MKAYEIPAKVTLEGTLDVPSELMRLLPAGQTIRLIVLLDDSDEIDTSDWRHLTAEQFLAGYSGSDSIYDRLT